MTRPAWRSQCSLLLIFLAVSVAAGCSSEDSAPSFPATMFNSSQKIEVWVQRNPNSIPSQVGMTPAPYDIAIPSCHWWFVRIPHDANLDDVLPALVAEERMGKVPGLRMPPSTLDRHLTQVLQLENLLELSLLECGAITDAGLEQVAKLQELRVLTLVNCDGITDAGLKHVVKLRRLRELDVSCCPGVTDEGLKEIAALKDLRVLYLYDCTGVTERGVRELQAALPRCRIHR